MKAEGGVPFFRHTRTETSPNFPFPEHRQIEVVPREPLHPFWTRKCSGGLALAGSRACAACAVFRDVNPVSIGRRKMSVGPVV